MRLEQMGKSKADLAKHLGLPFARVAELINGKRTLKAIEILPFAQFMRMNPLDVLENLTDPDSPVKGIDQPLRGEDDLVFDEQLIYDVVETLFDTYPPISFVKHSPQDMAELIVLCAKTELAHPSQPEVMNTMIELTKKAPKGE